MEGGRGEVTKCNGYTVSIGIGDNFRNASALSGWGREKRGRGSYGKQSTQYRINENNRVNTGMMKII